MKELSIFVDESGDFGKYNEISPYYLITLIYHDQEINISNNINQLNNDLKHMNYPNHCLHTGPLIRREKEYKKLHVGERIQLLNQFYFFLKKLDIHYSLIEYNKSCNTNELEMISHLSKSLKKSLTENIEYLNQFDTFIIYYDRGQAQVTRILSSVFSAVFSNKTILFKEHVVPSNYKLFQAADVICTFELIAKKIELDNMSKSEQRFFKSKRDFKRNYYKFIKKKRI